ncbi:hypothetical protein EDB92DRAFT_1796839 [Lactarius akahatsu]|uniref:ubiquitinyl hydrolase 1 n=1 Tax=Lactarius akahatsu TaxID=416441 RepID=A0AAD4QE86_9AGAM|nr:hypothetical protein EDB92DRAFT_1796839 [Lactarius akahatsu]
MPLSHDFDSEVLLSVVDHVFLPVKLPQQAPTEGSERKTNVALCHILIQAAQAFSQCLSPSQQRSWAHMIKTMESIHCTAKGPLVEAELKGTLSDLAVGDVFVMHIRAQNASVIVRTLIDHARFEIFEVSPPASNVMSTDGKLLCSYPGPAVEVSSEIFSNECFLRELASFLVQMDVDVLDSTATAVKAGSTIREVRESAHPRYISELLVGILRGLGQPASVDRITKRIGDEVLWKDAYKPWRRSPLWLVIRVALQTSLDRDLYKTFILFFLAYLLQICIQRDFPSETLQVMRAKMARRLSKMGPAVSDDVYRAVYDAAKETETLLQNRWSSFQASQSVSPSWHPEKLDVIRDTVITLENSRRYLINALRPSPHSYTQKRFTPSHSPRLVDIFDLGCFSDGRLTAVVALDGRIALADFELSIERYLDFWVGSRQHDKNAPDVIASCVEQYYASARETYHACPEDNSVMILTIMDLWMALDKLTAKQYPLLTSYSPEIPRDFLHPILLHRSGSLQRARIIEEYISQRHQAASCTTSIFSDKATESSFAVRYFRDSPKLQEIYADINRRAEQQKEEKRAELGVLNERWRSLKDAASRMDHNYIEDYEGNLVHGRCRKCQTDGQANKLKIDVFEWPLPQATVEAQLVVFELSPPRAFSAWREITYKILRDIGMPKVHDTDYPKLLLDAFSALEHWAVRHEHHRITIGSTTKSFRDQTHYKRVQIPADNSNVLLNNGLSFKLYDRKANSWAARPFLGSTIANLCMPLTPVSSPYGKIHPFVCGTHHTSNEVIAGQADCPPELTPHEYLAFSGLRSGPRLQWLNIARELSSPSLSFRREEIHTLITQAAWNLGPLSDGVREWHADLSVPSFGWTLLRELEGLLGRIEANWLEEVTVRSIALITSRLLSATRDRDICQRVYALLRKARSVAHTWIYELSSKLDTSEDETSCTNLRQRLCILAATCFSTYDVCMEHVPSTLDSDADIAIAVHCAVIVHDNTPSILEDDHSRYFNRLLNRHRRLLHFLEPSLRECVQSNPSGFDQGLASLWPGFRRQISSNWHVLPSPNSRWISCIVDGGQEVHYNLLTGQLLIGGNPLGRLPQDFVQHSTYASLLGTRVLDVVPADVPDMAFMTRSNVSGYQILFSLRDGNLTLRTRRPNDPRLLQFVPRTVFVNDFPKAFVDDCVHWLDLRTGEVEFRSVGSPWISDPSNWRLSIPIFKDDLRFQFRKISGDSAAPVDLIDIRSATFQMISRLLSPLESPEHIIITRANRALEASLNRLHLAFFISEDSELECRNMPGYVIDERQSCGTMFGLRNQLVLRPRNGSSEVPRRVIIPQGDIEFGLDGDFATVSIKTGTVEHVPWHEYTIDTDLGRLTGNVSLHSKLYQCYLHALTSHCLPDPLLGHTGTEESLHMLHSASFLSFQRLSEDDAKLLDLISNLTPSRIYYPPHLRSMVTVNWNGLPVLSQHHDFHPAVSSILDYARAMEALYDEPRPAVDFNTRPRDASLLNRAASRNRLYYPYDLQNLRYSSSSTPKDVAYKSRDVVNGGGAELAAYQTSWSVWNGRLCPSRAWNKLWDAMQSWRSLGPGETRISLRYSRYWLTFSAAKDWLGIYDSCQKALNGDPQDSRVRLAFSLSAASFSGTSYANVIPLILIFATDTRFRDLTRPSPSHYDLSDGTYPDHARLVNLISQFALPLEETPAQTMEVRATGYKKVAKERRREYNNSIDEKASTAAQTVMGRWTKRRSGCNPPRQWFNTQGCREGVDAHLQSITQNIVLRDHIHRLQRVIDCYEITIPPNNPYVFSPRISAGSPKAISPSLREVLTSRASLLQSPTYEQCDSVIAVPSTVTIGAENKLPSAQEDSLSCLIHEFRQSRESLLQLYGEDLSKSHSDLLRKAAPFSVHRGVPAQETLRQYRDQCSKRKASLFSELSGTLAPSQKPENVVSISGLWPRITPRSILRELSRDRVSTLNDQWKHAITRYAIAFLKYQQSQRLLELSSRRRDEELLREAETVCEDVAAACAPDWLLIQIDANFLARPLQLAIAREMISPTCQRSASFQLNMGEGKSSVIVPLVATTLADGSNLTRIVTLKPLSNQMFQLLLSRLSGLTDRRIFYVPFSRKQEMSASVVQSINTLYRQCVDDGGVLVVQPEHLLSQKLMCIDTLIASDREKLTTARQLKDLQRWLAKVSRDVLDESDEILHVRYQLVYTAGEQMPVEDHPNRWSTTQQVFSRLRAHAAWLHSCFPKMFELDQAQKGYPTMRILGREVSRWVSLLIVNDALGGALSTLSLAVLLPSVREAARRFILRKEVSVEDHQLIRAHCSGTTLWSGILLLRGLLVDGEGILGYVLKERRWRVDYGLDPSRTLLAVPYRAKDVPSLRAEFGHPDVAIALTCLSYYYGGLTKEQILQCFDLLTKLDNPDMEYDQWVEFGEGIPTSLRQVNGVNVNDDTQVDEHLVPLFSKNTRVIDFYLSQVVFPRAAKEFPSKLSTSAWDLVEDKSNVTTGFSGTNDNRFLLPTSITQEDPVSQLSTNALVLQYLLQPENNHYECTEGIDGERESAEGFLRRLNGQKPEIRVLLDVGAQMLELQNKELALHWLSLKPHISAAIYFNESDHLTVLTRDGTVEPLISSPFNRQLDKCIVYLDDAHTRGTDLKLPRETRAAVTLGPKVTKDRLLQGCMRMRQLGKGQSVMFFAPGEVDRQICGLIPRGQESENGVRVIDILRWAMHETCLDIGHHLPHWAQQGIDHHRRFSAYKQYNSTGDLGVLKHSWLQRESQTLEEMYEPAWNAQVAGLSPEINGIPSLRERLEHLGVTQLIDVRMAEEQEREVNHEVERERHVEPPPKVYPAKHIIHDDLRDFIRTGSLPMSSRYIIPLFSQTGIDKALDSTEEWSPSPLATTDFAITTRCSSVVRLSDYLRPVNWVLSSGSGKDGTVIVISPHEANELLPIIRQSGKVRLHVYAPRVTASMRSFSDLAFYTITRSPARELTAPAPLRIELNLFAGQLYFDSKEQYERVCELLALHMAHPGAKRVEVDGFVPLAYRTGEGSPFSVSVVSIFKELTGLRRKGMGFGGTDLGRVLDARPLSSEFESWVRKE